MKKFFITMCVTLICIASYSKEVITPENWKPQVINESIINSDRLDFDYELYIATFTGNVVIQNPQFTAVADKIVVVFEKDSDEENDIKNNDNSVFGKKIGEARQRVKSAIAIGNVKAVGKNQLITCDKATYFKDNALLCLTGNDDKPPVVQKDGRTISGQTIKMWLNDNRVETSGDIKVQIPSSN